eukprot:TRINITY_DN12579_c0_g1_i10.p1 TRINITY_DN12579_c0_g1~~TRINITY_DN12579_c0_g1_i10.p1  ORF type:complete len:671 (-),score=87.37 TRINITY_DN12579_c0_g1_i10:648-2630(-)
MTDFVAGDGVKLQGLAARPDLNDCRGRLIRFFEGRWEVKLGDDFGSNAFGSAPIRVRIREANISKVQDSATWRREINAQGVAAHKSGRYGEAVMLFSNFLEVAPNECTVLGNRAGSYLALGQAKDALQDAEGCIHLNWAWTKGWLRKIDALVALKEITRAYAVALDARKSLQDQNGEIQRRVSELASLPENEKFLNDNGTQRRRKRAEVFCARCGEFEADVVAKMGQQQENHSFQRCEAGCEAVRYCSRKCQDADHEAHEKVCHILKDANIAAALRKSGRVRSGASPESGEWDIRIDEKLRFCFLRAVRNMYPSSKDIYCWHDWAKLVTSIDEVYSRERVSEVLSIHDFRRIVSGESLCSDEEVLLHREATDIASYPLTIFHALRKFCILKERPAGARLVVHIVGAEAVVEGRALLDHQRLLLSLLGPYQLLIVSVGPMNLQSGEKDMLQFKHWKENVTPGFAMNMCMRGTYADFLCSDMYVTPDLVVAFHPGFYDGTYPWWPTLQFLLHEDVPIAVTCFSDSDLQETKEMVRNGDAIFPAKVVFEETNPFVSGYSRASLQGENQIRQGNKYLLGWRGLHNRFPKGGGVFDAGHAETMAMCVAQSLTSEEDASTLYSLRMRMRSYLEFAEALEKFRPHEGKELPSAENPGLWKRLLAVAS